MYLLSKPSVLYEIIHVMECSITDCQLKVYGRGYCNMHYARWQRGGNLNAPKRASHGLSRRTRQYQIWENLKQRCLNPNNTAYKYYGGRGIKLCDAWKNDFMSFYTWAMQSGYRDDLTLDRVHSDGNYEPTNCRWATRKEQQNNLRNNVVVEFQGEKKTLKQWSALVGISYQTLRGRMDYGWSTRDLLTKAPDPRFRAKLSRTS